MPWLTRGRFLAVVLATACRKDVVAPTTTAAPAVERQADGKLATLAQRLLVEHWERDPAAAVQLGRHEYDGRLRDVSPEGIARQVTALKTARGELEAIDPATLTPRARLEHAALSCAIRGALFELDTRKRPANDPMFYLPDLDLTPYVARPYAPLERRAEAIVAIANATTPYLRHAQAQLEESLPRPWVETALLQVRGAITYLKSDVREATAGLAADPKQKLDAALSAMLTALTEYEAFLKARLAIGSDDFALGAEHFSLMLQETQGIAVDLERLRALGEQDLARNLAALTSAAAKLDAKGSVAEVVAKVGSDKPRADDVLATAYAQATDMRKFLVDHEIVTIPSEELATIQESPPFMRWNSAFLDAAGPFDVAGLPSFYYISPPDPKWPKAQQRAYIPARSDLLFTTIHEVWPGHFLHSLHIKALPSDVLKSLRSYVTSEGWAHYAEEMMWDAGVSDDAKVHIGQLKKALLRNVRFLAAIGLHTGGMTLDQAQAMFREKAFQDEASARQQATRATFDPMVLSYTLGKLAIRKLHADWKADRQRAGRPTTLRAFHDELLAHGAAPLPAIRHAMLGPDAGPVL